MIIYRFKQIYIFEEAKLLSEEERKLYSLVEANPVPVSQIVAKGREADVAYPLRTAKRLLNLELVEFDENKENLQACIL